MTDLKPGRDLDALVAEKVFGFKTFKCSNPFIREDKSIHTMSRIDDQNHVEETKHYSTDIADAWEVVEKLYDQGLELYLEEFQDDKHIRMFRVEFALRDNEEIASLEFAPTAPPSLSYWMRLSGSTRLLRYGKITRSM